MTEEDQVLVAKAALAGVRFQHRGHYWYRSTGGSGMVTLPRAAARALEDLGLMTEEEYQAYDRRSSSKDAIAKAKQPVVLR